MFVGFEKHPSRIFDILDRTVGRGNYTIISGEGNFEVDDEDQEDDEEEDDYFDDNELDDNEEKSESDVKPMTRDSLMKRRFT